MNIVWNSLPSPLESKFHFPSEKLKKWWKYGTETGLLNGRGGCGGGGGGGLALFLSVFFQGLSFAKLCHAFEEKLFFSATTIL